MYTLVEDQVVKLPKAMCDQSPTDHKIEMSFLKNRCQSRTMMMINTSTTFLDNLPLELNHLIFAYANVRYHAGTVSNKFHPKDARLTAIETMLQKHKDITFPSSGPRWAIWRLEYSRIAPRLLRVTRFKYLLLHKMVHTLSNSVPIKYELFTVFVCTANIDQIDHIFEHHEMYTLNIETTRIPDHVAPT
jgi:hypothetical protein